MPDSHAKDLINEKNGSKMANPIFFLFIKKTISSNIKK